MIFSIYETTTGKIWSHLDLHNDLDQPVVEEGYSVIVGAFNSTTEYISNGDKTNRPTFTTSQTGTTIIANGTDVCLITGIPSGATVTSKGTTITADGNPIEFVTDIPGEHKLQITLWPYQDVEVVINAI